MAWCWANLLGETKAHRYAGLYCIVQCSVKDRIALSYGVCQISSVSSGSIEPSAGPHECSKQYSFVCLAKGWVPLNCLAYILALSQHALFSGPARRSPPQRHERPSQQTLHAPWPTKLNRCHEQAEIERAFTCFPRLPLEVRAIIWRQTLEPRVVEIFFGDDGMVVMEWLSRNELSR